MSKGSFVFLASLIAFPGFFSSFECMLVDHDTVSHTHTLHVVLHESIDYMYMPCARAGKWWHLVVIDDHALDDGVGL